MELLDELPVRSLRNDPRPSIDAVGCLREIGRMRKILTRHTRDVGRVVGKDRSGGVAGDIRERRERAGELCARDRREPIQPRDFRERQRAEQSVDGVGYLRQRQ